MQKMKKALLGTAIAGALVVGAGAGTYSWFNASYTASGAITNHTLTINNSTTATQNLVFGEKMLAPGRDVSDQLKFENTGSMDQILRLGLNFTLKNEAGQVIQIPDKSKFIVTATIHFTRGSHTYNLGPVSGDAQTIDTYLHGNTWFPDSSGAENAVFKPGDKVVVDLNVKLDENAGNEYQGKTLFGVAELDARQTDSESQF